MREIEKSIKAEAIELYKKNKSLVEISNLTNMSIPALSQLFRESFKNGKLEPKRPNVSYKKKFTDDEERQIAIDYYELNMGLSELKAKWNIHPMQLQRIREKFKSKYGVKPNAPNYYKARQESVADEIIRAMRRKNNA